MYAIVVIINTTTVAVSSAMSCPSGEILNGGKPIILLLGEIVLAHKEWDALRAIAELRVSCDRVTLTGQMLKWCNPASQ